MGASTRCQLAGCKFLASWCSHCGDSSHFDIFPGATTITKSTTYRYYLVAGCLLDRSESAERENQQCRKLGGKINALFR